MYWSITPEGRINNLPSEEFACNWSWTYKDDIVFVAYLVPPIDIPEAFTDEKSAEGKYKQGNTSYSDEVRRRFAAADATLKEN